MEAGRVNTKPYGGTRKSSPEPRDSSPAAGSGRAAGLRPSRGTPALTRWWVHGRADLAEARRDRVERVRPAHRAHRRPAHRPRRGGRRRARPGAGPVPHHGRVHQPGLPGGAHRRASRPARRQARSRPAGVGLRRLRGADHGADPRRAPRLVPVAGRGDPRRRRPPRRDGGAGRRARRRRARPGHPAARRGRRRAGGARAPAAGAHRPVADASIRTAAACSGSIPARSPRSAPSTTIR